MKINWKVRLRNGHFWFQLFLAVAVPIGGYFGITGADMTTWPVLINVLIEAISNPYVLFIIAVSIYNSVIDNTTAGLSDSERALNYKEPAKY